MRPNGKELARRLRRGISMVASVPFRLFLLFLALLLLLAYCVIKVALFLLDPFSRLTGYASIALAVRWHWAASRLASSLIARAADHPGRSDSGDAVHAGHHILGFVACREGDYTKASEHLMSSVRGVWSPVLASFGPRMDLARILLDRGAVDAVLEYLALCSSFWRDRGRLARWTTDIREGRIPTFKELPLR